MYNLISIDDILTGELASPNGFDVGGEPDNRDVKKIGGISSDSAVYSLIELSIVLYKTRLGQISALYNKRDNKIRAEAHSEGALEYDIRRANKLTQAIYSLLGTSKPSGIANPLQNLSALLVFLEPSTRTMLSFASAIQDLGMRMITFPEFSSIKKGESIIDTMHTINAMMRHVVIIRSAVDDLRPIVECLPHSIVINAGNGRTEHPTQALLDAATIFYHKQKFSGIKVAICGDTLNSRVAKSGVKLLLALGAEVTIISPKGLAMDTAAALGSANARKITVCHEITREVLGGLDVLMILRIQKERSTSDAFSEEQYIQRYCITKKHLDWLPKDAVIMHPGPINRNVEIAEDVLRERRAVFDAQVRMGVCARSVLLGYLLMINGLAGKFPRL